MISAVIDSNTIVVGDAHAGVYLFDLSHKGEIIASTKFELVSNNAISFLDLSEDSYDADYELSVLLDISPATQVWLLSEAHAKKEGVLADFILAAMQMIARQVNAYNKDRTYVAFVRPYDKFEDVWSLFESGTNGIVYVAKHVVALR